jgi:hypothetical protein
MNKENILKEVLKQKELRNKFWPNVDIEKLNVNTLTRENNRYLTALYYLFQEDNQVKYSGMINNIKKTFEL